MWQTQLQPPQVDHLHTVRIFGTQSEFLAKASEGPFTEFNTGVIDLPDEDPQIVARALWYFYHQSYDEATTPPITGNITVESTLEAQLVNVAVYALADKWFAPGLQSLAVEKFQDLSKKADEWLHGLSQVLRAVYTSTPSNNRQLRDLIVQICVDRSDNDDVDKVAYNLVLEELTDAHIDILKESLSSKQVALSEMHAINQHLNSTNEDLKTDIRKLKSDLAVAKSTPPTSTPQKWNTMASRMNKLLGAGCSSCSGPYHVAIRIDEAAFNFTTGAVGAKCINCGTVYRK